MADKQESVVRQGKDPSHGFARSTDGKTVFVHRSSYPEKGMDVLDGDVIRFNTEPGTKGPRATDVELIQRGIIKPTPTVVPTSDAKSSTKPVQPAPTGLRVKWQIESQAVRSPANVPRDQQAEFLQFIVTLTVRDGEKLLSGYSLGLEYKDGEEWLQVNEPVINPVTDDDGQTYFKFLIPPDAQDCDMKLQVTAPGGSALTSLSKRWHKVEKVTSVVPISTATPPAVKACKYIKVEVVDGDPGFGNILKIQTLAEMDPTLGTPHEVIIRRVDERKLKNGKRSVDEIRITSDAKGRATKAILFEAPLYSGDVIVSSAADPDIQSEPVYIRYPK